MRTSLAYVTAVLVLQTPGDFARSVQTAVSTPRAIWVGACETFGRTLVRVTERRTIGLVFPVWQDTNWNRTRACSGRKIHVVRLYLA